MKKLFVLFAVACLALTASAQFSNSGSSSTTYDSDNSGWSTIYLEYNPMSMYYSGKKEKGYDYDAVNYNGFSLGYSRAFALSQSIPIFLETGLGAQFTFRSDTKESNENYHSTWWKETTRVHMLSLKVPVNFMYKWSIPNSKVELIPYLGLTMRANVWGQVKESEEGEDDYEVSGVYSDSESYNLFSEDEDKGMGKGNAWKRFQIGWQIGLKARFAQKFVVGGSFGTDFMEIAKNEKFITGSIMLGYSF